MSTHTLSVLVENKPGVLARVASLFSRRGYNIDSLAVGPTERPEISRMTIAVNLDDQPREIDLDVAATDVLFATGELPALDGTTVTLPPESAAVLATR